MKLEPNIQENGICYTLSGDCYLPDLKPPKEARPIGYWGRMHKTYLEQHCPAQYSELILSGKLWTYLADPNEQAADKLGLIICIICQIAEAEGVTEALKAKNQMAWMQAMNSIRNRAEEIVKTGLVYC